MQLRDYQTALVSECDAIWHAEPSANVLAVAPTGSGKTVFFAYVLSREPGASVAIAHRSELVSQMSLALARNGVRHRVIGPQALQRACSVLHLSEVGRTFVDPQARCAVAGVDTLVRRDPKADPWFTQVRLVVQDECFPAGTLIDGRPIETIQVGDHVRAFNESTGGIELRRVNRLYRNTAPENMMRLTTGHHVVECTLSHPFFTRRGWVNAAELTTDDHVLMHALRGCDSHYEGVAAHSIQQDWEDFLPTESRLRAPHVAPKTAACACSPDGMVHGVRERGGLEWAPAFKLAKDGEGVLQSGLFQGLPSAGLKRDDGAHESTVRVSADERPQPDVQPGDRGQGVQHAQGDRAQTQDPRRQRARTISGGACASGDVRGPGVCDAAGDTHGVEVSKGRPVDALQTGHGELGLETGAGGRRGQSSGVAGQDAGCEENDFLEWHRLDGVEVLKREDTDAARRGVCDGHVYNFEVDGLHTYVAGGFVVHNCHHVLADNKWGKASQMFPNARTLGVTATPVRADGQGLGDHADGIMHEMVVGPTMRDLIRRGFLTEYRVFAPSVSDLHLEDVPLSASGDFSPPKLRAAVHKSHIVGDVVAHYLRVAPGKLGVTFAVDVESATELAAAYRAAGVPSEVVSADTPDLLRAQVLRRFRNREVLQLCNVDLFGEGFDLPAIEVVSMARPTQSYSLYAQQFGRALRPLPGKTHALIIDHVDNVQRHGLPDAPRVWTLDRRERRAAGTPNDVIPVRVCVGCTSVYERYLTQCPHCGWCHEPSGRSTPEQVDGILSELDPEELARRRGEVAALDGAYAPTPGLPAAAQGANRKHHWERQEAQRGLRAAMATWGGWKTHEGRAQPEAEALFYFRYGVSLIEAWALPRADAEALRSRIERDLTLNKVVST